MDETKRAEEFVKVKFSEERAQVMYEAMLWLRGAYRMIGRDLPKSFFVEQMMNQWGMTEEKATKLIEDLEGNKDAMVKKLEGIYRELLIEMEFAENASDVREHLRLAVNHVSDAHKKMVQYGWNDDGEKAVEVTKPTKTANVGYTGKVASE